MSYGKALIAGIYVGLARPRVCYWLGLMFCQSPMLSGIIVGALLGDWKTGAIVGTAIQPLFLVNYNIGATSVQDPLNASVIPVTMVVAGGMSQEAAVALAYPIGLISAQLQSLMMVLHGAYTQALVGKFAAEGNGKMVKFVYGYLPQLIELVVWATVDSLLLYFGGPTIVAVSESLPAWAMAGLTSLANVLPALGYTIIMTTVGKKETMPYFFAGFIFAAYTGWNAIGICCVGLFVAYLHMRTSKIEGEDDDLLGNLNLNFDDDGKHILTKKDVNKYFLKVWYWPIVCYNYINQHACGIAIPFADTFAKKLYGDDKEEVAACMSRHVVPYLTNFNLGGVINGAMLSLEEQRALDRDAVPAEVINSTKYALAGPVAAIGDSIDNIAILPVFLGLGCALAQDGMYWACVVFPLLIGLITTLEMYFSVMYGYKLGTAAAVSILNSKSIKKLLEFMAVAGIFILAGVSSTMINVQFAINISDGSGIGVPLQSIFDAIMPKCLSLISLYGMYSYLKKGGTTLKLLLFILVVVFALGALGIIA